jgi:hypothetical protein
VGMTAFAVSPQVITNGHRSHALSARSAWVGSVRQSDQLLRGFVLRCFHPREEKDNGGGAAAASNIDRH